MDIKKEYILETDDHINFQLFYLKMNAKKNSPLIQFFIVFLPIFYIVFSMHYIIDYIVIIIGIVIVAFMVLYYLLLPEYLNRSFLRKRYYTNDVSQSITIEISKDAIIEISNISEQKILPEWVSEFLENKDYLFLLNKKSFALILPKRYFSNEELEMVKEYYIRGENKPDNTAHNKR